MADLSVNQRLKVFIEHEKISPGSLRVKLGVGKRQQVNNWLSSSEKIPDKHLITIIKIYPDLSAKWLLTGEGKMFLQEENAEKSQVVNESKSEYLVGCEICREKDVEIRLLKKETSEKEKKIYELQKNVGALEERLRRYGDTNGNGKTPAAG